jgi:hypothetical protein
MRARTLRFILLLPAILLIPSPAAAAQNTPAAGITTPKQHFGFNIGDDYQLATYDQFVQYWQ